MMRPPFPTRITRRACGVALVIVLAFVVLLSGLVLAFFSRALSERQISNSSATQSRIELFSEGAAATVIGDLKQEIADGSTASTVTTSNPVTTTTLYAPKYASGSASTATPAFQISAGFAPTITAGQETDGLANLLKRSAYNVPFRPNSSNYNGTGVSRAANISTIKPAANGRFISTARWNKPLLMQATSLGDATPVGVNETTGVTSGSGVQFTVPDWILVGRDGTNPQAVNSSVVGRYAYTIYNEGGLLDANVAGYPSVAASTPVNSVTPAINNQTVYKNALCYADLTQLQDNSGNVCLTLAQVDQLVGWRNNASAAASGSLGNYTFPSATATSTSFFNWATQNTGYFLTTANRGLGTNGNSDRLFATRQQLIQFISNGLSGAPMASTISALQSLGTFSRSLNQPSYAPDLGRPPIVGPRYTGSGSASGTAVTYIGGNSAYGTDTVTGKPLQDIINPSFRTLRATSTFVRNNGSKAVVGEPLVKERFALNRLAWVTCNGPIANDSGVINTSDPTIVAIHTQLNNSGLPDSFLSQGGPTNIYKYFGLTWVPASGSNPWGYWNYNHGITQTIATLDTVRDLSLGSGQTLGQGYQARDADFFELVKAAVCAGSIAKATAGVYMDLQYILGSYEANRDTRIDNHIIQIGVNIIEQAAPACFPICVAFDDGIYPHCFWGAEDLPYMQELTYVNVLVKKATPPATAYDPITTATAQAVPITDPGAVASVFVPVVWNPNTQNPLNSSLPAPVHLRVCLSPLAVPGASQPTSNSYLNVQNGYLTGTTWTSNITSTAPWPLGSYDATKGVINIPGTGTANNSNLLFDNSATLYREPTPLYRPSAAVSNLSLDARNAMTQTSFGSAWANGVPEYGSGVSVLGMYVGATPERFTKVSGTNTTTYTVNNTSCGTSGNGCTLSMEYLSGSTWIPYMQYNVCGQHGGLDYEKVAYDYASPAGNIGQQSAFGVGGNTTGDAWYARSTTAPWDPRTKRWSWEGGVLAYGAFNESTKQTIQSMRPRYDTNYAGNAHGIYQGGMAADMNAIRITGPLTDNSGYVNDPDLTVRKGMTAAFAASNNTTVGMPLASPAAVSSRPIMLHRPFRNVGELSYVFSDTAFRNIDFAQPTSGTNALLDLFCIEPTTRADLLTAGKVDLNTRQTSVIQAILAGAYRDAIVATGDATLTTGGGGEAAKLAQALVTRTTNTASGKGALVNISDVVGRWISGSATNVVYDGYSADVMKCFLNADGTTDPKTLVQRFTNAPVRALANNGMAGTWNLLIDVVSQTGRYPTNATNLANFLVEGEKRVWVHVAIDRQTGQVIDQQFETVSE